MKPFLTIRSNLLFVNLVVVGLIMWLAISFLFIAATQSREAQQLKSSIETGKIIFESLETLATERDAIVHSLYSISSSNNERNKQLKEITSLVSESDVMLDRLYTQTRQHQNDPKFLDHVAATTSSIETRLLSLNNHRSNMNGMRNLLLESPRSVANTQDSNIFDALFASYSAPMNDLLALGKSMNFLSDNDASHIALYHDLLNHILIVNVDLATKNLVLSNKHILKIPMSTRSGIHDAILSQRIEHGLANIVTLAQASKTSYMLLPIAEKTQNFYLQRFKNVEEKIRTNKSSSDKLELIINDWQQVNSSLSSMIVELRDVAHESISILVDKQAATAKRNFTIDVLLVFLCFAITAATIVINRKVKRYAYHDSLTQLSNRIDIESALASSSPSNSQIHAVIFIDLDRFKSINDNYGHAVGDELLVKISNRLKATCNSPNVLARLGGDEFAVFVRNVKSVSELHTLAEHMVSEITRNVEIHDISLKVGASVGICVAPMDCAGGIEMLKNADVAMYHSKRNNPGNISRFNKEMANDYRERVKLELGLKRGLEKNEFHLVYQPKICTQTGWVKSVEALLRWTPSERGPVSPAKFIPIAEDIGMMGNLGNWALFEACREISLLQNMMRRDLQVAVNISAQQFGDEQFIETVQAALAKNDLSHISLELEVTESIVMSDVSRVITILNYLQKIGIRIAIDDFGTGYSSLQYLQQLPLNTLKIDRAFIVALDHKNPFDSVANSIVQLARLFNLETVAEGVETEDQDTKVRSLGVHHIQGYRYSKPVLASELPAAILKIEEEFAQQPFSDSQRAA